MQDLAGREMGTPEEFCNSWREDVNNVSYYCGNITRQIFFMIMIITHSCSNVFIWQDEKNGEHQLALRNEQTCHAFEEMLCALTDGCILCYTKIQ